MTGQNFHSTSYTNHQKKHAPQIIVSFLALAISLFVWNAELLPGPPGLKGIPGQVGPTGLSGPEGNKGRLGPLGRKGDSGGQGEWLSLITLVYLSY